MALTQVPHSCYKAGNFEAMQTCSILYRVDVACPRTNPYSLSHLSSELVPIIGILVSLNTGTC
jgi:hypothetical protein